MVKKIVWFDAKSTTSNTTKTVTSIWKLTPVVANIDVQNEDEISILVNKDAVTLNKDKMDNVFQGTSLERE